jgi:histidinol dehydrogenase
LARKNNSKVGLYIPGGTAPLFSTVLMLWFNFNSGLKKLSCVHHQIKRKHKPVILYAANLCGVTKILKVGGFSAGLTFGPKHYKSV